MTDDLDQMRQLRERAPAPSEDWVQRTRADLLAMADEEHQRVSDQHATTAPGILGWLREHLAAPATAVRRGALAGAAALVAVLAVGVVLMAPDAADQAGPVAGPTGDPQGTPSVQDEVALASSCRGGDGAYTVGYPEGWHTNEGDVASPCEFFDAFPVTLEPATGGAPEHPIAVRVIPQPFADVAHAGIAEEETGRTDTRVHGRDAVIVEWTSTGDGALPAGIRSYRYLVALDDERTLQVAAYDLDRGSFDEHRSIVDAMVDSLDFPDE